VKTVDEFTTNKLTLPHKNQYFLSLLDLTRGLRWIPVIKADITSTVYTFYHVNDVSITLRHVFHNSQLPTLGNEKLHIINLVED